MVAHLKNPTNGNRFSGEKFKSLGTWAADMINAAPAFPGYSVTVTPAKSEIITFETRRNEMHANTSVL